MVFLFLGLFLVSLAVMVYTIWKKDYDQEEDTYIRKWTVSKIIKCLLPWCLLSVLVDLAFNWDSNYFLQPQSSLKLGPIFLGGLPGYIFFSTYTLLVLFWIFLYHKAHVLHAESIMKSVKWSWLILNAVVYTIWFVLLLVMLIFQLLDDMDALGVTHTVEAVYAASLNLGVALLFIVYGIRMICSMRKKPIMSASGIRVSRQVLWSPSYFPSIVCHD
jgi:hypothetical protein